MLLALLERRLTYLRIQFRKKRQSVALFRGQKPANGFHAPQLYSPCPFVLRSLLSTSALLSIEKLLESNYLSSTVVDIEHLLGSQAIRLRLHVPYQRETFTVLT
jgi:hypothetical protein